MTLKKLTYAIEKFKKIWNAPSKEDNLVNSYINSISTMNLNSASFSLSLVALNISLKQYDDHRFQYVLEKIKQFLSTSYPLCSMRALQKDISDIVRTKTYVIDSSEEWLLHDFISHTMFQTLSDLNLSNQFNSNRSTIANQCFLPNSKKHTKTDLSAFMSSIVDGDVKIIKTYISEGYKITTQKNLALLIATETENLELVKLLIDNGANYKQHAYEVVRFSASKKNKDILYYFLNLNIPNIDKLIENDYVIDSTTKNEIKAYLDKLYLSKNLSETLIDKKHCSNLRRKI